MPDVDEALRRLRDQSRENHALDDRVRRAQQKLAILESRRLALVAIHHDERTVVVSARARRAHGIAHVLPFLHGRNSRAAHAANVGGLEFVEQHIGPVAERPIIGPVRRRLPREHGVGHRIVHRQFGNELAGRAAAKLLDLVRPPLARFGEHPPRGRDGRIARCDHLLHSEILRRIPAVGIDHPVACGILLIRIMVALRRRIVPACIEDRLQFLRRTSEKIRLMFRTADFHARRRRAVAATETRHALHGKLRVRRCTDVAQDRRGARKMARHVAAHAQGDFFRRREAEVREETRHRLQAVERHAGVLRKFLQRLALQEPELMLNPRERRDERRRVRWTLRADVHGRTPPRPP